MTLHHGPLPGQRKHPSSSAYLAELAWAQFEDPPDAKGGLSMTTSNTGVREVSSDLPEAENREDATVPDLSGPPAAIRHRDFHVQPGWSTWVVWVFNVLGL